MSPLRKDTTEGLIYAAILIRLKVDKTTIIYQIMKDIIYILAIDLIFESKYREMAMLLYRHMKNPHFLSYFLNMNISVTVALM